MSHARASCNRRDTVKTVRLWTAGSSVARMTQQLPCCEPSGLLGTSDESAQSPPCRPQRLQMLRRCLETPRLPGDSSMPQTVLHQPWKNSALLGQPLLFNHPEDCNYVRKVFLVIPMGVNGHAEVGRIRKLDLEDLRLFLGRDDVYHRDVWNGRPMRQLSFFALSILQPIWGLDGGC